MKESIVVTSICYLGYAKDQIEALIRLIDNGMSPETMRECMMDVYRAMQQSYNDLVEEAQKEMGAVELPKEE